MEKKVKEFYAIITNSGLSSIATAKVNGKNVKLTHLAVGDSNGAYYAPDANQITLKNELYRGEINRVYLDPNYPTQLIIEASINENIGGFFIREIGIFDENGDLFSIGKYPVTYKPQSATGSLKDLYIRMVLVFSEAPNIELYVNPHNSVVSSDRFEALQKKLNDYALKDLTNVDEQYRNHQNLPGLQGGSSTERYHLTLREQKTLKSLDTVIVPDNKDKVFILNETGDGIAVMPSLEIFQNTLSVEGDTIEISEKYSIYSKNITSDTTLKFNSARAIVYQKVITFELHLILSSVFNVSFDPSLQIFWLNDDVPDINETGHYLIAFRSFDNGASWLASFQGKW